ncbi:hypothetical protein TanjilG_27157 [Lupinus angustifolius]|uniref:Myb/SANT-like DNA-binding domain-containing protein n=1 Tax=Lupinus angustifolius TaxID=3871 RepID=A0A4P1QW38_LUPAN|nr:PREDICTED: trihelix transcription factor GT-2 [Lupinus angustifolius]OIV96053.1 hypothetical protein TanjilG_27157 [Lupinus angustifolius]
MDIFAAAHVSPFPNSGDLIYDPLFSTTDLLSHRHKLRPIRPHGNSPPLHNAHSTHNLQQRHLQPQDPLLHGSGSSLDDDDDGNSSRSTTEPGSRKRSKKTARKLENFVQKMVMKVMEKQEQMHKQLVNIIEQKERERIMREEAWKREEMERIKKDEEARAEAKSRNQAIICFIQNLLGHEIQFPQTAEVSSKKEEHEGDTNIRRDSIMDPNNRWPDVAVQALITVRTSLEPKFRLTGSKGSIWEEISEAMHKRGYSHSAKKCKEKWENINKYYKRTVGSGKKRRQNSKTCPYFDELDILYRNGLLNHGNTLSITNNVPKIEKEESKTQ